MSAPLNTPHDHAFKAAMSDVRVAKDFFQHHLPAHVQALINLDALSIQNGSFIDESLTASETDILYQVQLRKSKQFAYLYLLAEHFSHPDRFAPFRLVKYCCDIASSHLKQHPEESHLPLVIPMVFYNGSKKYPYSMDVFDLFGEHAILAKELYLKPFQLIDLNIIDDEEMRRHQWAGMMEMVMKHAKVRDALDLVKQILEAFIQPTLAAAHADGYITSMLYYVLNYTEKGDVTAVMKLLHQKIPKQAEEKVMTLAEQLKHMGKQEGLQQGLQQGKAELIKELLESLHDKVKVAKLLKMDVETLDKYLSMSKEDFH